MTFIDKKMDNFPSAIPRRNQHFLDKTNTEKLICHALSNMVKIEAALYLATSIDKEKGKG